MKKILISTLLLSSILFANAQKAYNVLSYFAADQLFSYQLDYADGYNIASTISMTTIHSKKKREFIVDIENSTEKLMVFKQTGLPPNVIEHNSFNIKALNDMDDSPDIISAVLHIETETYTLKFKRKKQIK